MRSCFHRRFSLPYIVSRFSYIAIIVMAVLMIACQQKEFTSAQELTEYISEPTNKLTRTASFKGYEVRVSYTPADLLIYQEIGDKPTDHRQLVNLENKYQDCYHFLVHLSKSDSTTLSDVNPVEFSADITRLFSLEANKRKQISTDAPAKAEVLCVPRKDRSHDGHWIHIDLSKFGIEDSIIRFKVRDIESVPRLKFQLIS
jgi:hypothetical protein